MTSEFSIWLNGAPVIASGDPEFSVWLYGAPLVDIGAAGGGPGIFGGMRIVSPKRERANTITFTSLPWHVRRASPRIMIGRSPI